MRKTTILGAAALATITWATNSRAADEDFGQKGQFILSADRLMPFFAYTTERTTLEQPNAKDTVSTSNASMSLLFGRSTSATVAYTVPRVGFDYTLLEHFTLGGNLVLIFGFGGSVSSTHETPGASTTTSQDSPTVTGFGIEPRAGYIIDLSHVFYLWLLGGLAAYSFKSKTTNVNNAGVQTSNSVSRTVFGLALEPTLVIEPVSHVGITIGLPIDLGFAGSQTVESQTGANTQSTDYGYTSYHFGLNAGLLAYF
jgi:hypothetical protein